MNNVRKSCVTAVITLLVSTLATAAWAATPQISVGTLHTIALKSDGTLWAWGENSYGQLGDGTRVQKIVPVQIGADPDWTQISSGGNHTLALMSDGSLWAWGSNTFGEIGDGSSGSNAFKTTPTRIGSDTDWTQISAGGQHSIALKSDGSLWAWGYNYWGQLGDGTNGNYTDKLTPTPIGSDTDWVRISAGVGYTLALKSNGTLWAWGLNSYGQLGDGTNVNKNIPVRIGTDTDWARIAPGHFHTLALKSDGSLWAWGNNAAGQLGDGTNVDKNTPVRIGTDTNWTRITAGGNHYSIALKNDGSLWAWGHNLYGQLGDGTNIWRNTPFHIGIDTDWSRIEASGAWSTLALKNDGSLWAWGDNRYGTLGDGTTIDKYMPQEIIFHLDFDTDGDSVSDGFDACPQAMPIRIAGKTDHWQGLQWVYDNPPLASGDTIRVQSSFADGPLVFDRALAVTLRGGFDCDFTTNSGAPTVIESLTISSASYAVTIDSISIE
ncbi:MAG: hypothetical protein KKG47_16370 [Proteobacteria bacterium]|nr:hypothetical protein [Pseudomonadota bacterium]MBU1739682.1 hypothetical protein [Pseudomonadota bacterium]